MANFFRPELLRGKVAYVAGGSSGINLQIARCLADHGAAVAIVSRSPEKVDSAIGIIRDTGGSALGLPADVRDYDAIVGTLNRTVAELGIPDIVVSGAAGNFVAPAHKLSTNGFRTIVDIDLVGTFNVFRAAFDAVSGRRASFIAISAPQSTHPYRFQAHVCAAKAGVDMLVKCLALEWGPTGIRVNAIVPGPIADTVGMEKLTPTAEARRAREQSLPLQRYGDKQEVADLALFLASDASQYMTGAIVACDGGMSLSGDAASGGT